MAGSDLMEYYVVGGELKVPQTLLVRELLAPQDGRKPLWAGALRGPVEADGRVTVRFDASKAGRLNDTVLGKLSSFVALAPGQIVGTLVCRSVYTYGRQVTHFYLEVHPDGTITESAPQ